MFPLGHLNTTARTLIRRRTTALLAVLALSTFSARAFAQAAPGGMTPEQAQAIQDQVNIMQSIRDQVLQNVETAGVDPQQFIQDIQQQMQDGTIDFNGLQQMLVQKGYMTQQMADQLLNSATAMQTTVRSVAINALQVQLNASDEEWTVILPRVQKILDLKQSLSFPTLLNPSPANGGAGMRGMVLQPANTSDAGKAFKDLQTVLQDKNADPDRITAKLAAWREARDKAQDQLTKCQEDLRSVLTLRQEAILVNVGVL